MRGALAIVAGSALAACATAPKAPGSAAPARRAAAAPVEDHTGPKDYYVYVAAESADEVYKCRFDGEKAEIVRVIQVGYQPTEIEGPHGLTMAPDGRHWYLTMAHGKPFGLLYKYDTETDELVDQVELGLFPATMQISPTTGLLYCVNFDLHGDMSLSSVSIVDPDAMVEVGRTTTGPMPHGSRVSPDGLFHYSCSMMDGTLYEIDCVDFEVKRVLQLDETPPEHAGHHEHGAHEAGMVHAESKPTWVHPHPFLPRVYVCLNGVAQVAEVDLEKWEVVRRLPTDKGPYNVEVTPDGKKLLVSYKSSQGVGIWDVESGEELARIPTARKVTHGVVLSTDGRYGFVSSEGIGSESGVLEVFDMEANTKVCTLELGLQAGGITFWKAVPR